VTSEVKNVKSPKSSKPTKSGNDLDELIAFDDLDDPNNDKTCVYRRRYAYHLLEMYLRISLPERRQRAKYSLANSASC
jgi:hypothetical protein